MRGQGKHIRFFLKIYDASTASHRQNYTSLYSFDCDVSRSRETPLLIKPAASVPLLNVSFPPWTAVLYAGGCLKSWLLFRHPREFKIKSLYSNDLILNIASKSKETVQKLKFLDSPFKNIHGRIFLNAPVLYFQLASCICTVYFQKTDSMHSLSILRYLIRISAVVALSLKNVQNFRKILHIRNMVALER